MNLRSPLLWLFILALSLWFTGRHLATSQPVDISLKFDPKSQIIGISLKNDSDKVVYFYDSRFDPKINNTSFEGVPTGLCATIFSEEGQLLSEGINGCISIRHMDSSIHEPYARPMSELQPKQTLSQKISLKKLVGNWGGYKHLTELKKFCVRLTARFYFDPYLSFPVTRQSEVTCISSPQGMK